MLPIKKIYLDNRHSTADSKSTSDFKISLPNNITLPSNTAFYITDCTVPVSWYTVEAGRHDTIYFRINSTSHAPSKCTLPEGNYSTITLGAAMCKAMNDNFPFTGPPGTTPTRLFQLLTWPRTLSDHPMLMRPSKYLQMSRLLHLCIWGYIQLKSRHALLMTFYKTQLSIFSKLMELIKLSPMLCFLNFGPLAM